MTDTNAMLPVGLWLRVHVIVNVDVNMNVIFRRKYEPSGISFAKNQIVCVSVYMCLCVEKRASIMRTR